MNKSKVILISGIILAISAGLFVINHSSKENSVNKTVSEQQNVDNSDKKNVKKGSEAEIAKLSDANKQNNDKSSATNIKEKESKSEEAQTKADLYSDVPGSSLPLSAITILPGLPENVKNEIDSVYKNSNVLMAKKIHNKVILITENSSNMRLGIDFTEISLKNAHVTNTTLGYSGKTKDFSNEKWDYEKDSDKPIRHTTYDDDGDVIFVETWSYSPDEPIKYQMKDADGNVLSMRKETLENGSDLRVENLVYDKDGNTKINVSSTYDGADIKRFTYYNADKPSESGSVYSEYNEGLKTKEILYTSDLKVKNTITSDYKEGVRETVTVYDSDNNEIEKLSAE